MAPRSEVARCRRVQACRKSSTTSQNSCGACSNIQWRVPGYDSGPCARNMLGQHAPDHRQPAFGVAAADQQCRCLDRSPLRSSETACGSRRPDQAAYGRCRAIAAVARQASAPTRLHRRSPSTKSASAPSMSPFRTISAATGTRGPSGTGPGGGLVGCSAGSRSPPGSARTVLRNRSGRACATRNPIWPPREWPDQIDRPGIQLFDEADHVGCVLRHQIIAADAVPMLRKEPPQAQRNHAMLFRQRARARRSRCGNRRACHAREPVAGYCRYLGRHRDRPCRIR